MNGRRWRRWLRLAVAVLAAVLLVAMVLTAVLVPPRVSGWARARVIETLARQLDSHVELGELTVQLGPVVRVLGGPLVMRHQGRRDVAPLMRIDRFEATTTLWRLLRTPRNVRDLTITGLQLTIPPARAPGESRFGKRDDPAARRAEPPVSTSRPAPPIPTPDPPSSPSPVVIGRLRAGGAVLTILPREKRKMPRTFTLHSLDMRDIALDRPMAFSAALDNPQPRGRIETHGTFGPWHAPDPARTPLAAAYVFKHADLSTIGGLGGILHSEGRYSGVLERIEATGRTSSQDFQLDVAHRPMTLTTRFTVVVDGTNGNTWIAPAHAQLGRHTPIVARGGVVKAEDRRGRTVDLAVRIDGGRLEEVLALAVDAETPPMTGLIDVTSTLLIPPGQERVVQRLELDGRFSLREAAFTSDAVQDKVDELSRRARGRPAARQITHVVSAFQGRFRMAGGVITFPSLSFRVDGARIDLAGRYGVLSQQLHFDGRIRMEAGVSEMVTGKKRWALKLLDPLFRRNGATEFPLRIRGTSRTPEFGVDVKKTLKSALLPGG